MYPAKGDCPVQLPTPFPILLQKNMIETVVNRNEFFIINYTWHWEVKLGRGLVSGGKERTFQILGNESLLLLELSAGVERELAGTLPPLLLCTLGEVGMGLGGGGGRLEMDCSGALSSCLRSCRTSTRRRSVSVCSLISPSSV